MVYNHFMYMECIREKDLVSFFNTDENAVVLPVPQVRSVQVHEDSIYKLEERPQNDLLLEGYDALVTDIRGVCLMTSHADCIPVQLYDPEKRVIAAVHAGWRGTALGIAAKAARLMKAEYGCRDIRGYIGPGISKCCFEVGPEVLEAFADYPRCVSGRYVDLKEINRIQLEDAGVRRTEISPCCTCCDHRFLSYRRDRNTAGRMRSGIYMPL